MLSEAEAGSAGTLLKNFARPACGPRQVDIRRPWTNPLPREVKTGTLVARNKIPASGKNAADLGRSHRE